ncbi:MAG: DUF697 domain-containing protein [Myxococcota bacterium]|nr:DUF697 domain-containing protein [Myxococcota bacterium]
MLHLDEKRWLEVRQGVDEALHERLTLAFLGSASCGKDSAIRVLFGVDFGEINPIPGSTAELRVASLTADQRFLVVNAPGFGDLRPEVDQVGRQILESLDLVLYILNAEGGATRQCRDDLDSIRARARGTLPTLVCINKIDLIRPEQRDRFIENTLHQLGVERQNAVVCAFDPLPQISEQPLGVSEVIAWVHDHLADSGKDLLFAKHLRNKSAACEYIIQKAAKVAAAAGAIPVPGADLAAVGLIQVRMVEEIATIHDQRLERKVVVWLVGELLAGGSKGFIRWAIEALKAAGWLPGTQLVHVATSALGATIASACTIGIGHAAIRYMQADETPEIDELRQVFDTLATAYVSRQGVSTLVTAMNEDEAPPVRRP